MTKKTYSIIIRLYRQTIIFVLILSRKENLYDIQKIKIFVDLYYNIFYNILFVLFRSSHAYMDFTTLSMGIEHRYGNDDRDFSDDTLSINDTNVDLSRYVRNRDGYTVESYSPSQFINPSQYSPGSF